MKSSRTFIAGALIVAAGLLSALYAAQNYALGTIARMGPGLFPAALGVILAICGACLLVQSFIYEDTEKPALDARSLFFILAGLLAFAGSVDHIGMIPAIWLLTVISVLPDSRVGWLAMILLAAVLSLLAYLIFIWALALPLPAFRWSF